LRTKEKLYLLIGSIFLTTLLLLIILYGIVVTLIILVFCVFCAGIGSTGRSGYTAYRRKEKWVRKDGTVCHARKWKWEVSPEEVPDWVFPTLFLTVCFIIVIPLLILTFI
jgi:hypothetical protein